MRNNKGRSEVDVSVGGEMMRKEGMDGWMEDGRRVTRQLCTGWVNEAAV